jgi:ribose transport system permease protein
MDSIPIRAALRENFLRGMTKGGVYLALAILVIISGIISPKMLEPSYILEVLKVASILGIISIGQTLLILSRGIDLSVGVHMTLVMILIDGMSMGRPENTLLALIVALLVGLAVGAFNGLLVVKFEIEPLVGSLGVMTLLIGVSFVYTKGFAKGTAPPLLNFLGSGRLLDFFPVAIVLWILVAFTIFFVLRYTVFGRHVYASGANPTAAKLAGIRIERVRLLVYLISGGLTAFSGVIWTGYLGTPTLAGGSYYALDSIAAVVIGGTTFSGGKGGIEGTIAGVIIIAYLSSFLTILGIGEAGRLMVQGLIILALVFSYTGRKRA